MKGVRQDVLNVVEKSFNVPRRAVNGDEVNAPDDARANIDYQTDYQLFRIAKDVIRIVVTIGNLVVQCSLDVADVDSAGLLPPPTPQVAARHPCSPVS